MCGQESPGGVVWQVFPPVHVTSGDTCRREFKVHVNSLKLYKGLGSTIIHIVTFMTCVQFVSAHSLRINACVAARTYPTSTTERSARCAQDCLDVWTDVCNSWAESQHACCLTTMKEKYSIRNLSSGNSCVRVFKI